MARIITPESIRRNNHKQIYDYIYNNGKVTQNDISYSLRLSRPTVTTNIADLEDSELIFKDGQQDSDQIGRKAVVYSINPQCRIAIGVELTSRHIKIISVDLYGRKIDRTVHDQKYVNSDEYYKTVCDKIMEFVNENKIPTEKVLGVGIAIQGLVSPDGRTILYGKIMNCTGGSIEIFEKNLPFRCTFIHDPEGAALSELWESPEMGNAMYLSLSEHLGGTLIVDGNVARGKSGHTATFEHIQFDPNGELCYCGKRGCYETVLSMSALLGDEDEEVFFEKARSKNTPEAKRWKTFLHTLGKLISLLHLVSDVDYILGGHLAPYFTDEDIQVLYDVIKKDCPFDEEENFILISKTPSHNINIGAALPFLMEFLNSAEMIANV